MEICESLLKHSPNTAPIKPNVNTPSIFTIDHILSKAGSLKDTCAKFKVNHCGYEAVNNYQHLTMDRSDSSKSPTMTCHLEQIKKMPPILDWLQYTRYKPPRLPRPARNGPVKRTPGRLPRIPFTAHQLNELETAYKRANYLSSEDANKLATHLDLTCMRVKIWFQNRRARERRERRDFDSRTSYEH